MKHQWDFCLFSYPSYFSVPLPEFWDPPCRSKSLVLGPAPPWRRPGGRYAPESSALNQRRSGDRSGARPPAPAPRWHNLRRQDMVDFFFKICLYIINCNIL